MEGALEALWRERIMSLLAPFAASLPAWTQVKQKEVEIADLFGPTRSATLYAVGRGLLDYSSLAPDHNWCPFMEDHLRSVLNDLRSMGVSCSRAHRLSNAISFTAKVTGCPDITSIAVFRPRK